MTPEVRDFILQHGRWAPVHHLAAVIGQPEAAIRKLRARGVCAPAPRRTFGDLFALFHGRPPRDDEWPAPRISGGGYQWLAPELALVASLVGRVGTREIVHILTERLQKLTGDPTAERTDVGLSRARKLVGLHSADVVGGIAVAEAATRVGSLPVIQSAIYSGQLRTHRVGRLHVIPREEFDRWFSARDAAPAGYVRLATLQRPLGFSSDSKLPEFAKAGYIPTAVFVRSTHLWFVSPDVAAQIVADARAGRKLPWHGKPLLCNLKTAWRKWQARRHRDCAMCRAIWGRAGAPRTFEDFAARQARLSIGQKRHLTWRYRRPRPSRPWASTREFRESGPTPWEAARQLGMAPRWVQGWIRRGLLDRGGLRRDPLSGEAIRITPLGMATLRVAAQAEQRRQPRPRGNWMGVFAASRHCGVCIATIHRWRREGHLTQKRGPRGLLFSVPSLERAARAHWTDPHLKRATPPAWLQAERASSSTETAA